MVIVKEKFRDGRGSAQGHALNGADGEVPLIELHVQAGTINEELFIQMAPKLSHMTFNPRPRVPERGRRGNGRGSFQSLPELVPYPSNILDPGGAWSVPIGHSCRAAHSP